MQFHLKVSAALSPKFAGRKTSWLHFSHLSLLLVTLGLWWGCGRPPDEKAPSGAEPQNLPFDRQPRSSGISPSQALIPSTTKLPEGTPIPVRMQTGLSSASAHAGDTFNAIIDESVVIDGQTLVERGTTATGRVLEVKASAGSRGREQENSRDSSPDSSSEPGYLRIVLVSLNVGGRTVAIETSSIFAKGGSREERNADGAASGARGTGRDRIERDRNKDVEFGVDRHLSFRLAQAVDLQ
jgi:hypothetical protein